MASHSGKLLTAVVVGGLFYVGNTMLQQRYAHSAMTEPTITVTGEGKTMVTPDVAKLSFGVQTKNVPTAKAATDELTKTMNAILAAVEKAGVEKKDITTQSFWLSPIYDYTQNGQVFRGFQANQSLMVTVRDLDKAGDVLSAATEAGANQAGGINFTVDNPEQKRSEARTEAIAQAQEKAKQLAKELGMSLGDVRAFNEGGGGYPTPMYMEAYGRGGGGVAMDAAQSVPLPAGEQEVNVQVTITYALR